MGRPIVTRDAIETVRQEACANSGITSRPNSLIEAAESA
jgi:hypothetical protein